MNHEPISTLFVVSKYSKNRKIADFLPKFQGDGGMCARTMCTQMIEGDLQITFDETRIKIINF